MRTEGDNNTEQMILETAEKLFLMKGFAMTSTVEIAREAGCNQALVHYYYRSKEKLFETIFEKKVKIFISTFFSEHDANLSFEEKLANKIEAHFDILYANPQMPFLILNEVITNPKRLESLKDKIKPFAMTVLMPFQRDLDMEIAKGNIRQTNLIDLLLSILALNVVMFLTKPVIKNIGEIDEEEFNQILIRRKHENVRIILSSLKP